MTDDLKTEAQQQAVDPDDFEVGADHDCELDLSCPVPDCHWWTNPQQSRTIGQWRQGALDHIADAHRPTREAHR